jgi:hypothetical protein
MKTELIETGALIVRAHKGMPFYEAKGPTGGSGSASAGWAERGWSRILAVAGRGAEGGRAAATWMSELPTGRWPG